MKQRTMNTTRRRFLQGAGGISLGLPFLASLEPKAFGDPLIAKKPRFAFLNTGHGGAWESNMFPASSVVTTRSNLFADHSIGWGPLKPNVTGDTASVSPILRANAAALTPALGKMNVLYGLDGPSHWGHNTACHLGNFATGGDFPGVDRAPAVRPTIDQIMAYSPSFYPSLDGIRQREIVVSSFTGVFNYSDPSKASGTIQKVDGPGTLKEMFNSVFGTGSNASMAAAPRPIVDNVLKAYQALRDGNRRLSAPDKQRLSDHMERVHELQRQVDAHPTCSNVAPPGVDSNYYYDWMIKGGNPGGAVKNAQLWIDLMVTAFMCGASRISNLFVPAETLAVFSGDWHQDVAHKWSQGGQQATLTTAYQVVFEKLLLYMANKLNVEEAPGSTYLDNSLLMWSQESGTATHESTSVPVITFGSAGGFFKTGMLVDYRKTNDGKSKYSENGHDQYCGILYAQWLATVLQSMGIPPKEFERWGHKGYGFPYIDPRFPHYVSHYGNTTSRYFQMSSDIVPFLKA